MVLCSCRAKSDAHRDWIGCRKCCGWYHPECVGLSAEVADRLPSYTCASCQGNSGHSMTDVPDADGVIIRRAFEKPQVIPVETDLGEGDRYCICRRAYSDDATGEAQNFLQCEFCAEWYHYECLGVTYSDVEQIDRFKCPKCEAMEAVLAVQQDSSGGNGKAKTKAKNQQVRVCNVKCSNRINSILIVMMQTGSEFAPDAFAPGTHPASDSEYYNAVPAAVSNPDPLVARETCLLCGGGAGDDVAVAFIFCAQCGESFHNSCLNQQLPSRLRYDKIVASWRCMSCMSCSKCTNVADDVLMMCDVCERGAQHSGALSSF